MRALLRCRFFEARRPWVSWLVSAVTFAIAIGSCTNFLAAQFDMWQTALLALAVTVGIWHLEPPVGVLAQFLRLLRQAPLTVKEVAGLVPRRVIGDLSCCPV